MLSKVGELISPSIRSWNTNLIGLAFNLLDAIKVVQTPIRRLERLNLLVWLPDKTGIYSVKSGYQELKRLACATN